MCFHVSVEVTVCWIGRVTFGISRENAQQELLEVFVAVFTAIKHALLRPLDTNLQI